MIDVSDLHMVETILTAGSISRAAEALYVSQPTLSKRLARLESQLGARLFHRSQSGLSPTHIAQYLIESAAPVKARLQSIERQVQRILSHDQGEIRIGVGPIIEQVLLPRVLIELTRRSGSVRFSVITDNANVLLDHLRAGTLDVIAGPFDAESPWLSDEGIDSVELVREQTINVARASHPIFADAGAPFFAYPYASPPMQGTMISSTPPGVERSRLSSDNYSLLKTVCLATDYVCGGPKEIFRSELESGAMREIPNSPSIEWRSACLFRSEALETPLVRLFVDVILECRDEYLKGQ